jgi:formylmethanofuran dehydrogenase subunit E
MFTSDPGTMMGLLGRNITADRLRVEETVDVRVRSDADVAGVVESSDCAGDQVAED